MTGAGDADGEISRDEATWRDLVARFDRPADTTLTEVPWPEREDLPGSAATGPQASVTAADPPVQDGPGMPGPVADPVSSTPDQPPGARPGVRPWPEPDSGYRPADRTRVVRPAGDPRSYTADDDDDERYVPAPLPPPAKLDSISKAAVVAVIAGPGYLLIASVFLHWTISAPAAFVAVAAFVGGFVTLVVKLGDRSRRDDDDDGAVL